MKHIYSFSTLADLVAAYDNGTIAKKNIIVYVESIDKVMTFSEYMNVVIYTTTDNTKLVFNDKIFYPEDYYASSSRSVDYHYFENNIGYIFANDDVKIFGNYTGLSGNKVLKTIDFSRYMKKFGALGWLQYNSALSGITMPRYGVDYQKNSPYMQLTDTTYFNQIPENSDIIVDGFIMGKKGTPSAPENKVLSGYLVGEFYPQSGTTNLKFNEGIEIIAPASIRDATGKLPGTIDFPSTLRYLGNEAWYWGGSAVCEKIIMRSIVPPELEINCRWIMPTPSDAIYVPDDSLSAYQAYFAQTSQYIPQTFKPLSEL